MASKRSGGVYSNATREGVDWSPMTCDPIFLHECNGKRMLEDFSAK